MLSTWIKRTEDVVVYITDHQAFRNLKSIVRIFNRVSTMQDYVQDAVGIVSGMSGANASAHESLENIVDREEVSSSWPNNEDTFPSAEHGLRPNSSLPAHLRAVKGRNKASQYAKLPYSFPALSVLLTACLIGLFLASTSSSPAGHASQGGEIKSPAEALSQIQDQFEAVLAHSGSGLIMKWDITKAELAVEDLKAVVEESDLECRDQLIPILSDLVTNSAKVAEQLPDLDNALIGAVTHMLATNRYAVQALGEIKQPSPLSALLSLWSGPQERFRRIFLDICADMIEDMEDLLKLAIILRDDSVKQNALLQATWKIIKSDERKNGLLNEATLASVWTYFGSNKSKLATFKTNKELLDRAHDYNEVALKHVVWTIDQLRQLEALIKELRAKVGGWPPKKDFPIEHHIEVLMASTSRMVQFRETALKNKDAAADIVANGPKYRGMPAAKSE